MVAQHRPGTVLGDRLRDGLQVNPVMGDALGLAMVIADVAVETAVFEGIPESVAQARHFISAALPGFAWAELITSELATNAIAHTESGVSGEFLIAAVKWRRQAALIVVDEGGTDRIPRKRRPASLPMRTGGRGLHIVEELAEDHGWIPTVSGHLVWAVLARDSAHRGGGGR